MGRANAPPASVISSADGGMAGNCDAFAAVDELRRDVEFVVGHAEIDRMPRVRIASVTASTACISANLARAITSRRAPQPPALRSTKFSTSSCCVPLRSTSQLYRTLDADPKHEIERERHDGGEHQRRADDRLHPAGRVRERAGEYRDEQERQYARADHDRAPRVEHPRGDDLHPVITMKAAAKKQTRAIPARHHGQQAGEHGMIGGEHKDRRDRVGDHAACDSRGCDQARIGRADRNTEAAHHPSDQPCSRHRRRCRWRWSACPAAPSPHR